VLCNKRKKCASLGGVAAATGGDVKEAFGLSLGIYIEEVFAGLSSP
jgi:hypothetical protein